MMQITRRADGRYMTSLTVDGKRRYVYGHTKGEVDQKYQRLVDGEPIEGKVDTLSGFLGGWLAEVDRSAHLRPKTVMAYHWALGHVVRHDVSHLRLDRFTRAPAQRLFNDLATVLGPNSCRRVYEVLRGALADARADRLIEGEPLMRVNLPAVEERVVIAIDPPMARRIVEAVKAHRLGPLFIVTIALGLRQGEALGLRWHDIAFERQVVTLCGQVQRIKGDLTWVPRLKTKGSAGELPLNRFAAEVLSVHRRRQQFERELATEWERDEMVFTTSLGRLLDGTVVRHILGKLLDRAGLPPITFHDLRHATGSLLAAAEVHPSVMGDLMRHTDPRVTLRHYTHTTMQQRRFASTKVDDALSSRATVVGPDNVSVVNE